MLNREILIENVTGFSKNYQVDLLDIIVTHGGALVLHGVKNKTNDIDVTVPLHVWDWLINGLGYEPKYITEDFSLIEFPKYNLDVHLDKNGKFLQDYDVDTIKYRTLKQCLEDYLVLNRDKDQDTIKQLRELLK